MEGCMSSMLGQVNLSKGLQQLKDEHSPLRDKLEVLLQVCKSLEKQNEKHQIFPQLIDKVSAFSQDLEVHSKKEEDVLFPMMEKYIGKNGGPIAVMEYEHEQAKGYIHSFLEKTAEALSEEEMLLHSMLIKNAYAVLIDHFSKEENVLFPMGENLLSDSEKEELLMRISGK